MKRFAQLLTALILMSTTLLAQLPTDFTQIWGEVEALKKQGLPQSALKLVNKVYEQAGQENNAPEQIKALLYKISLQGDFQEEHLVAAIQQFIGVEKTAQTPQKEIINSLLAQLLQHYYTQHKWEILQRTPVFGTPSEDIQTWDAMQFEREIQGHYLSSLQNKTQLEKIPLAQFNVILNEYNTTAWPTLYDFLANRALLFFSESSGLFNQMPEPLFMPDSPFLASVETFIGLPIKASSIGENQTTTLILFQRLLAFHYEAKNTKALIDLDLRRLDYVYRHSVQTPVTEARYLIALSEIVSSKNTQNLSLAYYTLADFYYRSLAENEMDSSKSDFLVKAAAICNKAIGLYPDSLDSAPFEALLARIMKQEFSLVTDEVLLPNRPALASVTFKNVSELYFKVVRLHTNDFLQKSNRVSVKNYLTREAVLTFSQELPKTDDYRSHQSLVSLPSLKTGAYVLFVSNASDFNPERTIAAQTLWVSDLSYISKDNNQTGNNEFYVLDRTSGRPVGGVDIQVYQNRYNNKLRAHENIKVGQLVTNKEGYTLVSAFRNENYGNYSFLISKNNDTLFSDKYLRFYQVERDYEPAVKTFLFTDRAIYRPGQTIFYKGIIVSCAENKCGLVTGESDLLQLFSPSGKKLLEIPVVTDKNGSFQGSFVIPDGQLNGQMNLRLKTGSSAFRVEEYKRPGFFIQMHPDSGQFKLSDTIPVFGQVENYAGNPVSNASVSYRVTRSTFSPRPYRQAAWFPPYLLADYPVAYGQMTTDQNGGFAVRFKAIAEPSYNNHEPQFYVYNVFVQVTDITGEVHDYQSSVRVGSVAALIDILASDQIDLDNPKPIQISATNLSGVGVELPVRATFFQLKTPEKMLFSVPYPEQDKVLMSEQDFREKFPTLAWNEENNPQNWMRTEVQNRQLTIDGQAVVAVDELKSWPIGEYVLEVEGVDLHGEKVSAVHYFSLYSTKKKDLPALVPFWVAEPEKSVEPGQSLLFSFGSADKKARILVEISRGMQVISREWISPGGKAKTIQIPVEEEYRGGFQINTTMVLNNRLFSQRYFVDVPFSNKKLDIVLQTERNFVTPGEKETWSIKVTDINGSPLVANLMAGMYDASLDQLAANTWDMSLYHQNRPVAGWEGNKFNTENSFLVQTPTIPSLTGFNAVYPEVNWFGYLYTHPNLVYEKSLAGRSGLILNAEEDEELMDYVATPVETNQAVADQEVTQNNEVVLRKNFNETAFFYPDLGTDSEGNVIFSFDTPDALTTWKLMMLAYTTDLKTGSAQQEFKAKKSLMVMPNVPRFVRQGDVLDFSAKVVNLSEADSKVTVAITFFDPLTGNDLDLFSDQVLESDILMIQKGQSAAVSREINIPFDLMLLGIRVSATDGTHADGEEHVIPVLTNRVLVTETMPMNVKATQEKTFEFTSLINTGRMMRQTSAQNLRFTVEFTSNPAWYAIQALPSMSEPVYKSTLSVFNRYQANALSSYILNSNPLIKQVFNAWKQHSPDAFLSNLQKNEQLKSAVLEATPWVLEAENEADQKQRIALLFDLNRLAREKEQTMEWILASQLPSGAWPWFDGMRDDRYTTQAILLGLAKLDNKGVLSLSSDQVRMAMVQKALRWLDDEMVNDYNKIIKEFPKTADKNHLSATHIQFLYLRSLLSQSFPVQPSSKKAIDYFVGQARKYWLDQGNYLQAMLALALPEFGYRNVSEAILRSLTERALVSEELGMYWRHDRGWGWYEAPVETQAMLIEAFSQLQKNVSLVDQMKVWLLKQKQTGRWSTSTATAEAVYALLMTGGDLLTQNTAVDITVGGQALNISQDESIKAEAGSGYFSKSWSQTEIFPEMGEIKVNNPNNHVAWGAAYWQYFENMDKVIAKQTTLGIEKKLFVETATDSGLVLMPTKNPQVISIGDKLVVRMVVTTDRDLEFVHLSDTRATGLEPISNLSGYVWSGGLGFYRQVTDTGIDYFIRYLPKGTYVIEYGLFVTQKGTFTNGIATIQSMYAPEFAAHSGGSRVISE